MPTRSSSQLLIWLLVWVIGHLPLPCVNAGESSLADHDVAQGSHWRLYVFCPGLDVLAVQTGWRNGDAGQLTLCDVEKESVSERLSQSLRPLESRDSHSLACQSACAAIVPFAARSRDRSPALANPPQAFTLYDLRCALLT